MRALLIAGLLLMAGCTAQPVSAPPNSIVPPVATTPPPTSEAEPPAEESAAERIGCPDVIPSDVMTDLAGEAIEGAWESVHGNSVTCRFHIMTVWFRTDSDEESFAQRRAVSPDPHLPRWTEVPDFYDEAYQTATGGESSVRSYVAVRQGSVEVWLDWGVTAPARKPDFRERLFATVFERLG